MFPTRTLLFLEVHRSEPKPSTSQFVGADTSEQPGAEPQFPQPSMTLRNPAPSFFPCKQHGQEILLLRTPLLKTALPLQQHREELRCGNWHGRSPLGLSPCSTRWHGAGMGPRVLSGHTKCPSQLSAGPAADSHFQFLLLLITTPLLQIHAMLSPWNPPRLVVRQLE